MINDKFEPMHLVQRKITTPLFRSAKEALGGLDAKKQPIKYLLIESNKRIPENVFMDAPICPIFVHRNRSYILLQGECMNNYFLAHRKKDIVLSEEQVWRMMLQISRALLVLRQNGYEHRQLREYTVRRVNAQNFRLLFHPEMTSGLQLIDNNICHWYQLYFAPEQLGQFNNAEPNSCVFSLAAMVLNIMNPLDSKRDIYSSKEYELNVKVIEEKLRNASSGIYSNKLVDLIRLALTADYRKRPSLQQFVELLVKYDPVTRKNKQIESWRQSVSARMSKSKSKSKSKDKDKVQSPKEQKPVIKDQTVSQLIDFERGTFGGSNEYEEDYEEKVVITYNDYHQNQKIDNFSSKKIQKSPSAPVSPSKQPQYSTATLHQEGEHSDYVQKLSQFDDGKQREVMNYQIGQFNSRVCDYHIKLEQCLQPIQELTRKVGGQRYSIDEDIYYGTFINGRRNGIGLAIFPKAEYYYGHFKDDLFHGQGFYFWHNSQYFLGIWEGGRKVEGTWEGKAKYIGQIKDNRRHGIGTCFYPSGRVYQGEWFQGRYQGSGIITEPCGDKFIGLFRCGKKWGRGYFLTEHCRISGIWDGDTAMGPVQINYDNGNYYSGPINADFEKHGQGECKFKNGVVCKGFFQNDAFLRGEVTYRNGQRYVGEMKDYKRHGRGKYYYNNGKIGDGIWEEGRLRQK